MESSIQWPTMSLRLGKSYLSIIIIMTHNGMRRWPTAPGWAHIWPFFSITQLPCLFHSQRKLLCRIHHAFFKTYCSPGYRFDRPSHGQRWSPCVCNMPERYASFVYAPLLGFMQMVFWLGCNILAVACYSAAGFTFGTVAAPAAPAAVLGCNAALGTCVAACAATALIAPIPWALWYNP